MLRSPLTGPNCTGGHDQNCVRAAGSAAAPSAGTALPQGGIEGSWPQQRERVDHRLGEMSVEELARGSGVSAAALRQGGVATAADVFRRTVNDLDDIRNIGPPSARKIMELATDYEQIRPDDLRPPANPDAWTGADYALVRRLAMLTAVTGLAPHAAVLREVLASVGWLARTTSWLAWPFSTSSRKARIQSRAPEILQAEVGLTTPGGCCSCRPVPGLVLLSSEDQ